MNYIRTQSTPDEKNYVPSGTVCECKNSITLKCENTGSILFIKKGFRLQCKIGQKGFNSVVYTLLGRIIISSENFNTYFKKIN